MLELRVLNELPDGLLEASAPALASLLGAPTLIHLPGLKSEPLFVSVLLHGNEDTGFDAVREVLSRYRDRPLPRAMSLFIGNVSAAAAGVRTLENQRDFNRVWPGTEYPDAPEAIIMQQVLAQMRERRPFASIDIHNNTGLNPHYACINRLDAEYLYLARLFSRVAVYFTRPVGVQSAAMASLCPAVTVECGKVGVGTGTGHAVEFIEACLHLDHFPAHPLPEHDIELLQTVAIVKVPEDVSFSFDGADADIRFRTDIDHLNFSELAPGTVWGQVAPGSAARLLVMEGGEGAQPGVCFDYVEGEIRLATRLVPAMLTRDQRAVRLDCLCYLMRRIGRDGEPLS